MVATTSCVSISPDVSPDWVEEDPLPEGRVMGNMITLPDGRLFVLNGVQNGVAGYNGTLDANNVTQAYGTVPLYAPIYYDPKKPAGTRWYRAGVANSTVIRAYHSAATLLPDGSILTAGSNPNPDVVAVGEPFWEFFTEYRAERFYPDYFAKTKPSPTGLPTSLSYGGDYFNISLSAADSKSLDDTMVTVIRTGFSTHAMNMGQRFVQLNNTYTKNSDGSSTLHVSQLPPLPGVLAPGPALLFVVVGGVPSNATMIMVGSGKIETQPILATQNLPKGDGTTSAPGSSPSGSSGSGSDGGSSGAMSVKSWGTAGMGVLVALGMVLLA